MSSGMNILALPRFVTLKGDNGRYLCLSPLEGRPHLRFVAEEISDPTATMEILVADDGSVRFKHTASGKFWRLGDDNFIYADANNTVNNDTIFLPFEVNSQSIALLSSDNNLFCTRYSLDQRYPNALNANANFTNFWAQLKVEEAVKKREISNIVYDLDKATFSSKIYVALSWNSATNTIADASTIVNLKFPYENSQTTIWKTKLPLKMGAVKATFETTTFPVIVDNGKVGYSDKARRKNELDETITTTFLVEDVHKVEVPPKTKLAVKLIATWGRCDIPFTFTQTDTLYNGKTYTSTEVAGNTYTVSNYYDFRFETSSEAIDA